MDQICGLFRVFGKSVRTYSLPFWHGRPLENIVYRRKLHACRRRGCLHYNRTTFLCAQTRHGQSTCSCGGASWAESHFGRIIARRRHLKLYMALGNANVCIALCRFFLYTHTSSSTTANTRDRCLLPCRSVTFSRLTLSGWSGLSRLTASRATFLIKWRARLLIVGMVLCISPLGAKLARVAGRSSLQRMRFSVFALVGVRVFHVYPFFLRALWMWRGREEQSAPMSHSSANDNDQEAHTKRTGSWWHLRRRGRQMEIVCLTPQDTSPLNVHQLMSLRTRHTARAERSSLQSLLTILRGSQRHGTLSCL